ncbi:hypothetical protein BD408DRAFT_413077 [Parasitella parasitica]|nr:hypothetical protein BD408DRAFT_413077 [Parasitella parasitica]
MKSSRRSIKNNFDNKSRWRDKFKQQCDDRMKEARQDKINKIREDQLLHKILEQEWDIFKKENEDAMRNEGIDDIDNLIEESMWDEEADMYFREEEENLSQAMDDYQAIVCVNCQKAALISTQMQGLQVLSCPNCGFYATEMCLNTILQAIKNHSMQCYGLISYILEPGTDDSIIAACNICDLWDLFKL